MCNEFHNSLAQIPLLAYTCRMGKNYCIFRLAKAKTRQDVTNLLKEQHRAAGYDAERADAERSHLNTYSCGFDEAMKIFDGLCPKKRRKNAVVALNFVISTSNEFPDAETEKKFYAAATDFLQKNLGQVVSWAIHRDETSTHFQAVTVPLVDGKLNARALCGGSKKKMQALQTRFWEEVGKPFGLERGEYNSKANHKTVEEFHSEERAKLEAEKEAVEAQKKALEEREKAVAEKEVEVEKKAAQIKDFERSIKENSLELYAEVERGEQSRFYFPSKTWDFWPKVKATLTGLWKKIEGLTNRNKKLEQDLDDTQGRLENWRNTDCDALEEMAQDIRAAGCRTWAEFDAKNSREQKKRSRSSRGFGYD